MEYYTASSAETASDPKIQNALDVVRRLHGALGQVIRGRDDTIKLVLAALLADGHVLLEDYPGSGKTTLTKTLGRLISGSNKAGTNGNSFQNAVASGFTEEHILPFRRIQFTPDMLPGDVLGVNVFDSKTGSFKFLHGPVFAHIVLADEINRTGPKVQAAFLECMAEKQVTIDNVTYPLDKLFFVLGTQNPLDIAGTYPLPIVQLDRFLLKIPMNYVDRTTEITILSEHESINDAAQNINPVCTREDVLMAREAAQGVFVHPNLRETIVDIVQATRNTPVIQYGASTRAAIMLQAAVRAWALVHGRGYATEDDLKFIAPFVLSHRIKFHGGAGDPIKALRDLMAPHIERLVVKGLR